MATALNIQWVLAARKQTKEKGKLDQRVETCNNRLDYWRSDLAKKRHDQNTISRRLQVWEHEFDKAMNELHHFEYLHNH